MSTSDSPEAVLAALRAIADAFAALNAVAPGPGEAPVLGGHMFENMEWFVAETARAVADRPDLFPDLHGEDLLAQQRRADAWLALRLHLQTLLGRATQSYLKEQGEAARRALRIVRAASEDRSARGPERQAAFLIPLRLLHRRQRALLRRRDRNRDGSTAPQPRRRTSAALRARARAEVEALFAAWRMLSR